MRGKAIEIFLVNGTMDGIVTAEMLNWNGRAVKIPRSELQTEGKNQEGLDGTGIYFLFCWEDDAGEDYSVYIGEADDVCRRLNIHVQSYKAETEKFYWQTAVAFFGADLNKANIRFMENALVMKARGIGRRTVLTKKSCKNVYLKPSQKAATLEFMQNVEIILGALGYDFLREAEKAASDTAWLFCKGKEADARGFESQNGFTVAKGSAVATSVAPSFEQAPYYCSLRKKLEQDGTIKDGIFQTDYEFRSPSAAASVVLGASSNGNVAWKNESGTTLGSL